MDKICQKMVKIENFKHPKGSPLHFSSFEKNQLETLSLIFRDY